VHQLPISETAPESPVSPYGVHKRVAEKCCESYGRHFGLAVAVVRLFSVYGAGLRKQLLWEAAQMIRLGRPEFFGTGEEMRDWLHVRDASALLLAAADNASSAVPIVNGGTGTGVTVRDILSELFGCLGYAGVPAFSGVARSGDPVGYVADIALARRWGWQPLTSRQSGLQEFADWIKGGAG